MNSVFGDTFYFLALLNRNDACHARAVQWSKAYTGKLVTTEWVLIELANGLASTKRRAVFNQTRQRLLTGINYKLIPLDMALHEEAIRMYDARSDKEWSLTDCISFLVMQREGITEALTGDHHFEQAGFKPLLK